MFVGSLLVSQVRVNQGSRIQNYDAGGRRWNTNRPFVHLHRAMTNHAITRGTSRRSVSTIFVSGTSRHDFSICDVAVGSDRKNRCEGIAEKRELSPIFVFFTT